MFLPRRYIKIKLNLDIYSIPKKLRTKQFKEIGKRYWSDDSHMSVEWSIYCEV